MPTTRRRRRNRSSRSNAPTIAAEPSAVAASGVTPRDGAGSEKPPEAAPRVTKPFDGSTNTPAAKIPTGTVTPSHHERPPAMSTSFLAGSRAAVPPAALSDRMMYKLKGTRPDLFRISAYYAGAKSVYMTLAGLPVLKSIAPTVESVTESVINMTPLKPSPEEQAGQKLVAVLDKKIYEALMYADEVVDTKKDKTIEGVESAKKTISTLGAVETAVGLACYVGDGVGKAYTSANDTVGKTWEQAFNAAWSTYVCATTMAGDAVNHVTSTAGSAASQSEVGNTANSITSTYNWATSTAMSFINAAIAIPAGFVQSVVGTNEKAESSAHSNRYKN